MAPFSAVFGLDRSLERSQSFDQASPCAMILSDVERDVVLQSAHDPLSSATDGFQQTPSFMNSLMRHGSRRLTDEKFEALRRFAVILRVQGRVDEKEMKRFLRAGFGSGHAASVEGMVAPWRSRSNLYLERIAWSIVCMLALASYCVVARTVEQPMIGLLSAGLTAVILAPVLVPRHH